jgi:hypothetical protein
LIANSDEVLYTFLWLNGVRNKFAALDEGEEFPSWVGERRAATAIQRAIVAMIAFNVNAVQRAQVNEVADLVRKATRPTHSYRIVTSEGRNSGVEFTLQRDDRDEYRGRGHSDERVERYGWHRFATTEVRGKVVLGDDGESAMVAYLGSSSGLQEWRQTTDDGRGQHFDREFATLDDALAFVGGALFALAVEAEAEADATKAEAIADAEHRGIALPVDDGDDADEARDADRDPEACSVCEGTSYPSRHEASCPVLAEA